MDENSFNRIEAQLDAALRSKERQDIIAKIREEAYRCPGEAGRRVVDVLEALGKIAGPFPDKGKPPSN
jgi:hypothetical protein